MVRRVGEQTISFESEVVEQVAREVQACDGRDVVTVLFGIPAESGWAVYAQRTIAVVVPFSDGTALSTADRQRLEYLLENFENDTDLYNLTPIGWLHIRANGRAEVTPEDAQILERHFEAPGSVAWVISVADDCAGILRARQPDLSWAEVAIEAATTLRTGHAGEVARPARLLDRLFNPLRQQARVIVASRTQAKSAPPQTGAARAALWLASMLLLAAVTVALVSQHRLDNNLAEPVSLHVSTRGSLLEVAWNRANREIARASHGTLEFIEEDGTSTVVPLSERALQQGSVTYKRASKQVEVRLRLYDSTGMSRETVALAVAPTQQNRGIRARTRPTATEPAAAPETAVRHSNVSAAEAERSRPADSSEAPETAGLQ